MLCHGLKWINHFDLAPDAEEAIVREAVAAFRATIGRAPEGWMCRYGPSPNTRAILRRVGGFRYDSDSYADELPYFVDVPDGRHLVIPHTFANNDNKFRRAGSARRMNSSAGSWMRRPSSSRRRPGARPC